MECQLSQQESNGALSVRLVSDLQQHQQEASSGAVTVIQLSRPVPVIKRACSPPLLELEPPATPILDVAHGVHFLTPGDSSSMVDDGGGCISTDDGQQLRNKNELLEYLIRGDGSVTCKLCGEILASRTHWYRHKYKLHSVATCTTTISTGSANGNFITSTVTPSSGHPQPSPLYKCEHCSVFFKSKKGYLGHVAARHTATLDEEESPVLDDSTSVEKEPEKTKKRESAMCNSTITVNKKNEIWEQQREKEEKLVADIIDRVRRECEAQGAMVSRRGYSRRSTVMNTCN